MPASSHRSILIPWTTKINEEAKAGFIQFNNLSCVWVLGNMPGTPREMEVPG